MSKPCELVSKEALKVIADNLRYARKKANLKQAQVPDVCGVAYRHYQDIEAGKVNVTIDTLFRLAKAFNVTLTDLMWGIQ